MEDFEITTQYHNDLSATPVSRNVLIFLDGTWNDENGASGDGVVTNIVKLYRLLEEDSEHQIARYFRGVGNDEDNGWWGSRISGMTGANAKSIRDHAYATIVKEYHPGDRLFIFGFSRGAATARLLVRKLEVEGIREHIEVTTSARSNTSSNHVENSFSRYTVSGERIEVPVTFLGVWDTVGAFGIPVKLFGIPFNKINLFHDMHVSKNVRKAVHMVSLDETRGPFTPTLMNHDPEVVEEVWFPGVHSDTGGGYFEDQVGDISLRYMIASLNKYVEDASLDGIRFQSAVNDFLVQEDTDYDFHFHGLGYKKEIRKIQVLVDDKPDNKLLPNIHHSVLRLQKCRETYSLVEKKKFFQKKPAERIRIIYNPANVKVLEGGFNTIK